jgi:hypothetical protein
MENTLADSRSPGKEQTLMKNKAIHLAIFLAIFTAAAAPMRAADATYNNLTVTGTGNFGTWSVDSGPGLSLIYTDGTSA